MTDMESVKALLQEKFNLRVPLAELKAATPEVAQKVYTTFLTAFKFRVENFSHVPFNIELPDPELHQDVMFLTAITATMGTLLKKIGSTSDFYLGDVISPRPKRFQRITMHLCQFYSFWESRMRLFEPIQKELENNKIYEQNMRTESEELKRRINHLFCGINEAEERVEGKCDLHSKLEELTTKKDKCHKEKVTISAIRDETDTRLKRIIQEREQLPTVIENHRSTIRPMLSEVQKSVEEYETEAQKLEEQSRALRQKEESLVSPDSDQVPEKLKQLIKLSTQVHTHAQQLLDCDKKLPVIQESFQTYKDKIVTTEKNIPRKREMLNIDKQQNQKKLRRRQCMIEEKRSQLLMKDEIETPNMELKYLKECENNLLQSIKERNETIKALGNDFTVYFNSLRDSFRERHKNEISEMKKLLHNLELAL